MNRKDELKTEILTNIKDEIIDKQTEKRYRLLTMKRRPKWIIPSSCASHISLGSKNLFVKSLLISPAI